MVTFDEEVLPVKLFPFKFFCLSLLPPKKEQKSMSAGLEINFAVCAPIIPVRVNE